MSKFLFILLFGCSSDVSIMKRVDEPPSDSAGAIVDNDNPEDLVIASDDDIFISPDDSKGIKLLTFFTAALVIFIEKPCVVTRSTFK